MKKSFSRWLLAGALALGGLSPAPVVRAAEVVRVIPSTPYTRALMTNETAAAARGHLGAVNAADSVLWTGRHIFSRANDQVTLLGASAAADNQRWWLSAGADGSLSVLTANDMESGFGSALSITRSGTTVTGINLGANTTVNNVLNAVTGFQVGGLAGNQQYLRGNGSVFVGSGLVAADLTGVVALGNGGTSKALVAALGAVVYSDADSLELTGSGGSGQVLTSQGAAPPIWTTPTTISVPVSIANGGTANTTFNNNSVIFFDGTKLSDDGVGFTYGVGGDNQLSISRTMGPIGSDIAGVVIQNTTGATLDNQQFSPSLVIEGQGWQTNTGTSQRIEFMQYVAPEQGSNAPTGAQIWAYDINNSGTYTELMRLDTRGQVQITKNSITNGAAGQKDYYGLKLVNRSPATGGTVLNQWSPPLVFEGGGWKTAATATNQIVRYSQYLGTVEGVNNPTGFLLTGYDINQTGTNTEQLRLDSTGFMRFTVDGIGDAQGEKGLRLYNNTAATAGVQQHSPRLIFRGQGWKSSAVAQSMPVEFRMGVVPFSSGGAGPTGLLYIDSEINDSGTFANAVTISSSGSMSVGAAYDPGVNGVVNAQLGYKVGTSAPDGQYLRGNGTVFLPSAIVPTDLPAGTGGDVDGPASATDNAIARYDGTTGKLLQNSGVIISDVNLVTIPSLTSGRVTFAGTGGILTDDAGLTYDSVNDRIKVLHDAIGSTETIDNGLWMDNSTASTGGAPDQNSPALTLRGSTFVGANQNVYWKTQVTPGDWLGSGVRMGYLTYAFNTSADFSTNRKRVWIDENGTIYTSDLGGVNSGFGVFNGPPDPRSANWEATFYSDAIIEVGRGGTGVARNFQISNNLFKYWTFGTTGKARFGEDNVAPTTGVLELHDWTGNQNVLELSTATAGDDPNDKIYQARATTTDATATAIGAAIPITANRTYKIKSECRARRTGGTAGTADDGAVYERIWMVTTKAGTVTENSTGAAETTIEDQAGWNHTGSVSGANFFLNVTGAINNNVAWHTTVTVSYLGN